MIFYTKIVKDAYSYDNQPLPYQPLWPAVDIPLIMTCARSETSEVRLHNTLQEESMMTLRTPKKLAFIGGVLISISGVVNAILGVQIGAILYDAYPGGNMGHVGIVAGIGAMLIGLIIVFAVLPLYSKQRRWLVALGGILTVILGHLGAVWGVIYVGTVGLVLCYIAGFWTLGATVFLRHRN